MTFWTNSIAFQKQYDFRLYIGTRSNSLMWHAKSVSLPKFTTDTFSDLVGLTTAKTTGQMRWDPIEIQIADVAPIIVDTSNARGMIMTEKGPKGVWNAAGIGNSTASQIFATLARLYPLAIKGKEPLAGINPATMGYAKNKTGIGEVRIEKIYETNQGRTLGGDLKTTAIFKETWRLVKPKLSAVDFGALDYAGDEMNYITLTFEYNRAMLDLEPFQED